MRSFATRATLLGCPLLGALAMLFLAPSCSSEECAEYDCDELTDNAVLNETLTICERDDGYIRLDDEDGEKLYECFCELDSMKDAAGRICSEGAVCRKAGSPCSGSGDCCAGLFCTVNTCG